MLPVLEHHCGKFVERNPPTMGGFFSFPVTAYRQKRIYVRKMDIITNERSCLWGEGVSTVAGLQDMIDMESVKDHTVLQLTYDALDRDITRIESIRLKLSEVYLGQFNAIRKQIVADTEVLRDQLLLAGIHITKQTRTADGVETIYSCRGRVCQCPMTWAYARARAAATLRAYLSGGGFS